MAQNLNSSKPVVPDLWGDIFRHYDRTGESACIIRRDDDLEEHMSLSPYFGEPGNREKEVLERITGRTLDIGCGPGRVLLWLQSRGIEAVGIDISGGIVELARQRGCKVVYEMSLQDIAELPGKFDFVTMFGNNAGLAGSLSETSVFLERLHSKTNEGAVLIAHSIDPTATNKEAHFAYHRRNEQAGRYKGQVTIRFEFQDKVSPWCNLVFFEKHVLKEICQKNGWVPENVIDAGSAYFLMARRS